MTIKIGSNIASIQAQRRLGEATSSLSTIYERLSSGQRINKASDDAAGLAISSDLNSKSRIFSQALKNVNDGVSVSSIADSAVATLTEICIRLKELGEQSATGTYSTKQRDAIDKEAQALSKEYFRISRTTQFNGLKLFDGSLADGLRLQAGIGQEGSILTHVGGKLGTGGVGSGTQFATETLRSYSVTTGDLNGDGFLDMVTGGMTDSNFRQVSVRFGIEGGNFGNAVSYSAGVINSREKAVTLGDLNGDGILDLVTAGYSSSGGFASVRLGSADGSFATETDYVAEGSFTNSVTLGDLNGDGILDLVTAGGLGLGLSDGYATVRLGFGNGNFGAATSFSAESRISTTVSLGDLNGDGVLDLVTAGVDDANRGVASVRLGNGNGSFGSITSYFEVSFVANSLVLGDLNGDGILDLVTAGEGYTPSYSGYANIRLGTGSGTFGAARSFVTEDNYSRAVALGDLNGDGFLDIITAGLNDTNDGYGTIALGLGNGSFGGTTSFQTESRQSLALTLGDLNGDGVTDVITAGYSDSLDGFATIHLGTTRDGISPLQPFSLKSRASALQSLSIFTNSLNNLSALRGTIGANLSRLSTASANLASTRENYIAASSRITDADIAQDAANLTRVRILQQAATSVLAQANQAPALALTLLR